MPERLGEKNCVPMKQLFRDEIITLATIDSVNAITSRFLKLNPSLSAAANTLSTAISTRLSLVNANDPNININNNIVKWYPALYMGPGVDVPHFYNENCYRNKFDIKTFAIVDYIN